MSQDITVFADAYIEVGGRNFRPNVTSVEILKQKDAHDLVVLKIRGVTRDNSGAIYPGAPAKIVWGRKQLANQRRVFYGYVVGPNPYFDRENRITAKQHTDILLLGASMVLKQPFTTTFINHTVDSIVHQVANSVMFSTDVDDNDTVWPQFSVPGLTGWQVLQKLAHRVGWYFVVDNTNLHFMDHVSYIARHKGKAPPFQTIFQGRPESITDFSVTGTEILPKEGRFKAHRYAYGINAQTSAIVAADDDPVEHLASSRIAPNINATILDKLETDIVADTPDWVRAQVEGATRRNRFSIRATATLNGDVRVSPGTGVFLMGLGPKHSGLWSVECVKHVVSAGYYNLEVELGRDSWGETSATLDKGPRVLRSYYDPQSKASVAGYVTPPTVLANGVWRAAWDSNVMPNV